MNTSRQRTLTFLYRTSLPSNSLSRSSLNHHTIRHCTVDRPFFSNLDIYLTIYTYANPMPPNIIYAPQCTVINIVTHPPRALLI